MILRRRSSASSASSSLGAGETSPLELIVTGKNSESCIGCACIVLRKKYIRFGWVVTNLRSRTHGCAFVKSLLRYVLRRDEMMAWGFAELHLLADDHKYEQNTVTYLSTTPRPEPIRYASSRTVWGLFRDSLKMLTTEATTSSSTTCSMIFWAKSSADGEGGGVGSNVGRWFNVISWTRFTLFWGCWSVIFEEDGLEAFIDCWGRCIPRAVNETDFRRVL